jgi:hypothetical protein
VLLIAAQDIADRPPDDPAAHTRALLLLQRLDSWAQQHPQPAPQDAELWKRLQALPWCPVLVNPPEQGLPWPHTLPQQPPQQQQVSLSALSSVGSAAAEPGGQTLQQQDPQQQGGQQQQQQQQVWRAAPKMVAPTEMAWLVSGPLRLLAAPRPSRECQELLGWTQQQVLRPFTACVQLAQLGEMYPAGTVRHSCSGLTVCGESTVTDAQRTSA